MRSSLGVVAVAVLAASSLAGCRQAPPPEESAAGRQSFEDDGWEGAASSDEAGDPVEAEARSIEEGWQQVRESDDDAERQRQAGELLERTRELADDPPDPQ